MGTGGTVEQDPGLRWRVEGAVAGTASLAVVSERTGERRTLHRTNAPGREGPRWFEGRPWWIGPPPEAGEDDEGLPVDPIDRSHPLAGTVIDLDPPAAPAAPRVHVARIGAVMLLLGLASGLALAPARSPHAILEVRGARHATLLCGEAKWVAQHATSDVLTLIHPGGPALCTLDALTTDRQSALVDVDLRPGGRYRCGVTGPPGSLSCEAR